jgi:hypothetical protein
MEATAFAGEALEIFPTVWLMPANFTALMDMLQMLVGR